MRVELLLWNIVLNDNANERNTLLDYVVVPTSCMNTS